MSAGLRAYQLDLFSKRAANQTGQHRITSMKKQPQSISFSRQSFFPSIFWGEAPSNIYPCFC